MVEQEREQRKILHRRTEKQWRHQDRELTSTCSLWNMIFALQGAVAAVSGALVGVDKFPNASRAFPFIGTLSIISMLVIVILYYLLRTVDHKRAAYFEVTSRGKPWPDDFNQAEQDDKSKGAQKRYIAYRKYLEPLTLVLFLINCFIFAWVIMTDA